MSSLLPDISFVFSLGHSVVGHTVIRFARENIQLMICSEK